jgi:hypothetical protein
MILRTPSTPFVAIASSNYSLLLWLCSRVVGISYFTLILTPGSPGVNQVSLHFAARRTRNPSIYM